MKKEIIKKRNCPSCSEIIPYTNLQEYRKAVKKNTNCRRCKNNPKPTNCEKCSIEFTYKTIKPHFCVQCKKEEIAKTHENQTRKCKCGNTIKYSTKYEKQIAENNNSQCSKCVGKIHAKLRKGKNNYDLWIEKGLPKEEALKKWKTLESKRLKSRSWYHPTEETMKKIISSGFKSFYNINDLICQGTWEKKYIEDLILKGETLPQNAKRQMTEIGGYFPDFEFEDRFVEIKSTFTYDVFCGKRLDISKKISRQRDKVIIIGATVKPIQLLVFDKDNNLIKEEWYTPNGVEVKLDLMKKKP